MGISYAFVALGSGPPCNLSIYEPLLPNSGLFLQVATLQGWASSTTGGMENAAGMRAVKALKASGHPDAVRFCGKKVGTTAFAGCRCYLTVGDPKVAHADLNGVSIMKRWGVLAKPRFVLIKWRCVV